MRKKIKKALSDTLNKEARSYLPEIIVGVLVGITFFAILMIIIH